MSDETPRPPQWTETLRRLAQDIRCSHGGEVAAGTEDAANLVAINTALTETTRLAAELQQARIWSTAAHKEVIAARAQRDAALAEIARLQRALEDQQRHAAKLVQNAWKISLT